ncbi:MAG TPA: hypothetical protein VMY35_14945 [Phycisphaerae bacterium]|nr:hypothetical protein [Phycisphaerae bacterium]
MEFETVIVPGTVKKEATLEATLTAGAFVKAECGEEELAESVPEGKVWTTVINIRVIETDAT